MSPHCESSIRRIYAPSAFSQTSIAFPLTPQSGINLILNHPPPPKKKKSMPTFLVVFYKTITFHLSSFHQAVPTQHKVKENIDIIARFLNNLRSTFASTLQSTLTIIQTLETELFMAGSQGLLTA